MFWQNLESDETCSAVLAESDVTRHAAVMVREVVELLDCRPGKNFLDLTAGGGGHASEILRTTSPDGRILAADRDPQAVARARERLSPFGERASVVHASFRDLDETVRARGSVRWDGALLDCGVSSDQLDAAQRGFSFRADGPLDMRMDPTRGFTAEEWLRSAQESEVADALFRYGEERHSRRIARAIVAARGRGGLRSTAELAELIRRAVPSGARYGRIHPATRSFQAIRIVVNDELGQLEHALGVLPRLLPAGARIAVVSFHSLEDRAVKEAFRALHAGGRAAILTKKPLTPSETETATNPRSRSAKLRALELLGGAA
jgi:16S rRNA (cytosine1402-N4)-methyltransferase